MNCGALIYVELQMDVNGVNMYMYISCLTCVYF